jgi:hypothetical protein
VTSKSKTSGSTSNTGATPETDVQTQIYALANALGIKPAELSAAIRPLIDPTAPNPAEAAQKEADLLKAQLAAGSGVGAGAAAEEKKHDGPGIMAAIGEALLD